MARYVFDLSFTATQLQALYRGEINTIRAQDREGRWVQFGVAVLRRFVSYGGVHGTFAVDVDASNRITRIERV
jgi:hypothetical protein